MAKLKKLREEELKKFDDVSVDDTDMSGDTDLDTMNPEDDKMDSESGKVSITVTDTGVDIKSDTVNLSIDGDVEVTDNTETNDELDVGDTEDVEGSEDELSIFDGETGSELEDEDEYVRREDFHIKSSDLQLTDITKIFSGQQLTEEFKGKAKNLFEAVVVAKTNEMITEAIGKIEEKYNQRLSNNLTRFSEKVDDYLESVVNEWFEKNTKAIDSNLKVDVAEELFRKIANVLEESHIVLPEAKFVNLQEEIRKNKTLQEENDRILGDNRRYKAMIVESKKEKILEAVAEKNSLSANQKDKFAKLCEEVTFRNEKEYTDKVNTLLESFVSAAKKPKAGTGILTEVFQKKAKDETVNDEVNLILQSMRRPTY